MVPADSQQIPRARCYSGTPNKQSTTCFRVRGSHPLRPPIPRRSTNTRDHSEDCQILDAGSHNTACTTPDSLTYKRFSLIRFRSPLLTESRLFSLPAGTEMFHFPAFPPHTLCVQVWVTPHDWGRVSPFGNSRISARLTAPLDFSQSPTSFIGSWCQDIHRMPLLTCYKDARIHCAVLKEQSDPLALLQTPA